MDIVLLEKINTEIALSRSNKVFGEVDENTLQWQNGLYENYKQYLESELSWLKTEMGKI